MSSVELSASLKKHTSAILRLQFLLALEELTSSTFVIKKSLQDSQLIQTIEYAFPRKELKALVELSEVSFSPGHCDTIRWSDVVKLFREDGNIVLVFPSYALVFHPLDPDYVIQGETDEHITILVKKDSTLFSTICKEINRQ